MHRLLTTGVLVAAALACGVAGAQPHAEPEIEFKAALPVTEPAAIAEWLKRLRGRFKYDGMVQVGDCVMVPSAAGGPPPPPTDNCQGIKGKSDCVGIGDGPGVQCILNVIWQDIFHVNYEDGTVTEVLVSYLDPAMELYGVDPRNSAVTRMMVDNKGRGENGSGFIKGDTAKFKSRCVSTVVSQTAEECFRIVRIEAKPDARLLYVWLGTQYEPASETTFATMALRRVTTDEESAPTLKSAAQRRK
ncbi:MAG: hypothetical protein ABI645_01665 [Pseudomonadota bacterium]